MRLTAAPEARLARERRGQSAILTAAPYLPHVRSDSQPGAAIFLALYMDV
jgi:hypothetical protein